MSQDSVAQNFEEMQLSSWIFEQVRFNGSDVFCPMCEIWHENNTNCQRSE